MSVYNQEKTTIQGKVLFLCVNYLHIHESVRHQNITNNMEHLCHNPNKVVFKLKKKKEEMLEFTKYWMPTVSSDLEPFLWVSFLQIWETKMELKLYTLLLWLLITRLRASQYYLWIIITLALMASVISYIKHSKTLSNSIQPEQTSTVPA